MPNLIPPQPFRNAILVRTALLWVFLRSFTAATGGVEGLPPSEAVYGGPLSSLYLVGVILAALFEMWRRSELVFLQNLGHSFVRIGVLVVVECVFLDASLWLLVA